MSELFELEQSECAQIAIPIPVGDTFSYIIPPELEAALKPGVRVKVPFRNREMVGYFTGKGKAPAKTKLKTVLEVLDEEPVLSENTLLLARQISDYYASTWGEAIENALPKWVRYGKRAVKALKTINEEVLETISKPDLVKLSPEQSTAMVKIQESLNQSSPKPILVFGVTGSGKSELYIRSIYETLSQGKCAVCLVPEIALTDQLKRFFAGHFGPHLEILHSKLTDREKFIAWKRIELGKRTVILGPRSAVFAPVNNLGLIVIDEEHEGSYKQETTPRYHAREVAKWRTENENALLMMGSATPSLETMRKAKRGDYDLIHLSQRIDNKALPSVQVIDLKGAPKPGGPKGLFSFKLTSEIEENIKRKEGTILLLNRRGFSTNINCQQCGAIETCDSCQVSLTFHQGSGKLLCHYCNYQKQAPKKCGECNSPTLKFGGFGTEKIESEIARCFPTARIARMDTDTIKKRGSHEEILDDFRNQKIDILVGTQMIAKGFDFPHVTLVGIVLADVGLMLPDFRSAERTFQLLTQVAGRAGRGNKPGRVILQTYSPAHASIQFAKKHDYQGFYDHETSERLSFRYPPSHKLVNIIIRGKDEQKTYLFAKEARLKLQKVFEPLMYELPTDSIEIIGPAPLPFYKLRGNFRWHVMIKVSQKVDPIGKPINAALGTIKKSASIAYAIDIDPLNIL